ncbi:MAG: ribonuclease H-like domain-containing protein [Proteobacteria bacterium]|nr:ribonuclease H-like domain-containing protein [Pseudomonadota bacterium]MBU1640949.1 ribonuclease H-like domain-containing protein [Pseudomonadota bacterium]
MLDHTFLHISGIGIKTEAEIWQAGIHHWHEFRASATASLRSAICRLVENHLARQPATALTTPSYFYTLLPSSQQWRLFPHFRDKTAFIDIETTGICQERSTITTIALYDGREIFTFVQGANLDTFPDHLSRYETIVTYNGKGFDVPMLERFFNMKVSQAHLDLRPILAALGYKGGLKGCERQLGIDRAGLQGVNGHDAVILWNAYKQSGQQKFLNTLLAYNVADTINLEPLMVMAYNLHIAQTPFSLSNYISMPKAPPNPFQADQDIISRLQGGQSFYR